MFWLEPDLAALHVRPTLADLEKIDFDGVLREAAEKLRQQAEDPAAQPRRAPPRRGRAGAALSPDARQPGRSGMKLLHVAVEGCGRFATQARIEGFGPGVNILSARNEAGKSTLFRAIRTCLFERHSSTAKDIAALATEGLSLPVSITVGFEHDGKRYEIAKSFLKSKAASLTRDGVEIARNAEADEQVWDLLGIAPKSTRALDEASYGLLWVQQGHSFDLPEPSEAATSQLNAVIQQEVGTLVGGERARQLLGTVRDELAKLSHRQRQAEDGRPAARRDRGQCAGSTAERLDVEARLAALDAKLDELSRLRADQRAASDPATAQAMKADLEETRRKLAEAEKAGEELKRLAAEEKQAHALAEAQAEKLAELQRRAAAIDAQRTRLKELAADLAPSRTRWRRSPPRCRRWSGAQGRARSRGRGAGSGGARPRPPRRPFRQAGAARRARRPPRAARGAAQPRRCE